MTVRQAEIIVAVMLALASLALMYKGYNELVIGWIPERGPGSGMWPFWLATGMFLCCVWTIVRWFRGTTAESRSGEMFMSRATVRLISITVIALISLLLVTHLVGIYLAIFLFLVFYLAVMGAHSWLLTANLSLATPVYLFLFFEGQLRISLPKGMRFADNAFVELGFYDLIYGGDGWKFAHYMTWAVVILNVITLGWVIWSWISKPGSRASGSNEQV